MKTTIIILFVFLSSLLKAQDSLPYANHKVIEFINTHLGEKIGQGVCMELIFGNGGIREYLQIAGVKNDSLYEIPDSTIMPGDIMMLQNIMFSDSSTIDGHIAVVYDVMENNKLGVAEQNAMILSTDKMNEIVYEGHAKMVFSNSRILLSEYDMSTIIRGEIIFLRF
jgi:hypothetical protein